MGRRRSRGGAGRELFQGAWAPLGSSIFIIILISIEGIRSLRFSIVEHVGSEQAITLSDCQVRARGKEVLVRVLRSGKREKTGIAHDRTVRKGIERQVRLYFWIHTNST